MDIENLKEYTNQAKNLEAAIYTHKNLMKQHEALMKSQCPREPRKRVIPRPRKPNIPELRIDQMQPNSAIWILIIFLYLFLICCIINTFVGNLWCILGVLLGLYAIPLTVKQRKKERAADKLTDKAIREHKQAVQAAEDDYMENLKRYGKLVEEANATYEQEMNEYRESMAQYNQTKFVTMCMYEDALASLEKSLQHLYNENVIYPKYRNMVAITAINEYLISGRCNRLEGADGAYNLYESELRQNIIIGQLSNIVNNLEQIRCNQYSLYEELTRSNRMVQEIIGELRGIRSEAKLTAYFTGITALAEVSPKFYISTTI